MKRMKKSEMQELQCPFFQVGHRCCQPCRTDLCVFYTDKTIPSDTEDWGSCEMWKE